MTEAFEDQRRELTRTICVEAQRLALTSRGDVARAEMTKRLVILEAAVSDLLNLVESADTEQLAGLKGLGSVGVEEILGRAA